MAALVTWPKLHIILIFKRVKDIVVHVICFLQGINFLFYVFILDLLFENSPVLHLFNTFRVISSSETIVVHDLFSLMTYLSDIIKLLLYGYCKSFGTSNIAFYILKYIPFQLILVKCYIKPSMSRPFLSMIDESGPLTISFWLQNLFLDFWDFPYNPFCLLRFVFPAMVFTVLQERKESSSVPLYFKAFLYINIIKATQRLVEEGINWQPHHQYFDEEVHHNELQSEIRKSWSSLRNRENVTVLIVLTCAWINGLSTQNIVYKVSDGCWRI